MEFIRHTREELEASLDYWLFQQDELAKLPTQEEIDDQLDMIRFLLGGCDD